VVHVNLPDDRFEAGAVEASDVREPDERAPVYYITSTVGSTASLVKEGALRSQPGDLEAVMTDLEPLG
jgi:hypothetical protein